MTRAVILVVVVGLWLTVASALLAMIVMPIVDLIRKPTFRRLAFRNISRRRGEAVLVIVGSLLGAAIITASYVVGDTIEGSIRDAARTDLGPIDETVRVVDPSKLATVQAAISEPTIPGVDGILPIRSAGAVAAGTGSDRRAVPNSGMVEVDFDQARRFGSDPAITGLADAGPTPRGDEALISTRLANQLGVGAGDRIEVFAYGGSRTFAVRQVLPEVGLAGYVPVRGAVSRPASVLVPIGTIDSLVGDPSTLSAAPPVNEVVVSNDGGVFDGAAASGTISAELTARVNQVQGVQVLELKGDLLDNAKSAGDSFSQLFSTVGYFSVIAGILLLINLFVMLSEERKSELGMLRAMGFKRNHLVRTFAIEGAVYSVVASVLGAVVSVGVSWVILLAASSIFSRGDQDLSYPLVVKPASLLTGAAIGLVISLCTVWGTSLRIARLNIIRAIRDLPEPKLARQRPLAVVLGAIGVAFGLAVFAAGWSRSNAVAVLAGPAIALFCLIPVLGRVLPRKLVIVGCSAGALVWGIGVFSFASTKVGRAGIQVFVVQGVVLVAAGVVMLAQADRVWAALSNGISASGGGLATRLGLAYPLARKFRTSMLLAMFSIVIFTMAFISVLSGIFGNQAPTFTQEVRAGYDLYVDSNQGNPVTTEQLQAVPGIESVAPLTRGAALAITSRRPEGANVGVTGFDERLLARGEPKLELRGGEYASDADAFRAVLQDPGLIIVNSNFGGRQQGGGGPPQTNLVPGDEVTLRNTATNAERRMRVVGVLASDFVGNGGMVATGTVTDLLAPRLVQNRHYVHVAAGADANEVASRVSGSLIQNGANARSFESVVNELLAQQLAFFSLLRGYLGLGLLIGIAGLGVVMVRAVRERRRQIGMLRAMGFSSKIVRRAFMLEAAFVALQGILLGIVLGMVTSYNLLVNSDAFGDQKLDFTWPWGVIAIIAVVPLAASLLATAWPATQAARIKPAVALRIAD